MYIKDLYIKNFRSIDYLHLKLTKGKNVVVGKNNAGKSNIIKALDICFGSKNPLYADVAYTDFHTHQDKCCDDFWILCRLAETDINEEELTKVKGVFRGKLDSAPFDYDKDLNELSLIEDKTLFDSDTLFPGYEKKTYFKPNGSGPNAMQELVDSLKKADGLWVLFHAGNSEEADNPYTKEYRFFYKEVTQVLGTAKTESWYVLWGISPAFRDALVTSAILPAFREPSTQLKATAWSWYGKLLKKVWDDKKSTDAEDGKTSDILTEALKLVEEVGNGIYENLANEIRGKISIAFNDTTIKFRYFHNLNEIYKQVQVFVNDGFDSSLQSKGSGIQSAVIIGLFSYYCSTFHQNSTILAIEEPELYLHPQARRVISKRLSDFVNIREDKQNQVIVITHSTEFIRAGELNSISVIKKARGRTTAAHYEIDAGNQREIQTLLRSENSEMFFADKVIICEGGEKFILPTMVDALAGKKEHLDECNISIVRANGKNDIEKIAKILTKCDIKHYAIADLDHLFEGLNTNIHPGIGQIRGIKSSIQQEWRLKNIKERLLEPDKSKDAAAFCDKMDAVGQSPDALPDLLSLWAAIKPKIMGKINYKYLDSTEGGSLKSLIISCLSDVWSTHRIYVLKRGELEDYLTDTGRKISGSKETRLLKIKQLVEDGESIDSFFIMEEFADFLNSALELEVTSPAKSTTTSIEPDIPNTSVHTLPSSD